MNPYYCLDIDPSSRIMDFKEFPNKIFDFNWNWPKKDITVKSSISKNHFTYKGGISITSLKRYNLIKDNKIETGIFLEKYNKQEGLSFDLVTATAIRLNNIDSKASPLISNIEVYYALALFAIKKVTRFIQGIIENFVLNFNLVGFYNLDWEDRDKNSRKYASPFHWKKPAQVKAVTYNSATDEYSEIETENNDISKKDWKIVVISSGKIEETSIIIDTNSNSCWSTNRNESLPQELVIDFEKNYPLTGFTSNYEFLVSDYNKNWKKDASGEFGNIKNNLMNKQLISRNKREIY